MILPPTGTDPNVLNYLPKRTQPKAKKMLHDIWQAETREDAHSASDLFIETFEAKYPRATECLIKDRDELLTFYGFPAQHWHSIRTSNPIESACATIRLKHWSELPEPPLFKGLGYTLVNCPVFWEHFTDRSKTALIFSHLDKLQL